LPWSASMRNVCAVLPRLIRAAVALCLLATVARASDFSREGIGTTSGDFLEIAVSARCAAMGEACGAAVNDASAMYWNPAGLVDVSSNSVVLMHASYLADTHFEYAAVAHNIEDIGVCGASIQYMGMGTLEGTDESGTSTGDFSPYDMAVSLGFATYVSGYNKFPEERFVMGATVKIINSQITQQATTMAVDGGLLSPYLLDRTLRLSFGVSNMMGSLRYYTENEPLPLTVRAGSRVMLEDDLDITADVVAVSNNYPFLAMGGEYRLPVYKDINAALRAGFNTRAIGDYQGFRNVSMGFGISGERMGFDYAFTPFGELGSVNRLSCSLKF